MDVRQDLIYASCWPSHTVRPILKVKQAPSEHTPHSTIFEYYSKPFFGWFGFRRQKCQFFCGRPSRPCLCIRFALTDLRTNFEGQTSPEASIPLISTIFVCYRKPFVWWSGFRRQKCQKNLWTFIKNFFYASGCPSRPVRPILKVKRATKRAYPSFRRFWFAITNNFLGDPDSDV